MKIADLVGKIEPFEFDFDGEVLSGTYYKYKTTTPKYAETLKALPEVPEVLTVGTEEQIKASQDAHDKAQAEFEKSASERGIQIIADTIVTWDAIGDDGEPIMPSRELFEQLPAAFTEKFMDFFRELRTGNPTNGNGSQPG